MSELEFKEFMKLAQGNRDSRDNINSYNYFGQDEFSKDNAKDLEIEMLLDRI